MPKLLFAASLPLVRGLAPRDRLEHEVDGRALGDERERRGHVRQHADLGRDVELGAHLVEHGDERMRALGAVGRGVDADHRVAGAEQEAVEDARGDGAQIVGRVIGLQPHRQTPWQPDGVAKARHHRTLRCHHHQILEPADLGDRRRHLRRDAAGERGELWRGGRVGEEPVAQSADGEMRDLAERGAVVAVYDEARHLVGLVGNDGLLEEGRERHVGERVLRRHPLFARRRRDARELIAAARRRRFRQQRLEVAEDVAAARDGRAVHLYPRRLARIIAQPRAANSVGFGLSPPSLPGLTRQSIRFARNSCEERWTRGSSPRVTHLDSMPEPRARCAPSPRRAGRGWG